MLEDAIVLTQKRLEDDLKKNFKVVGACVRTGFPALPESFQKLHLMLADFGGFEKDT